MVKGVSKRIIEVNQTGNKFFEKIVFYVTPEYGNLSAKQLKKATENFSFSMRDSMGALNTPYLRGKHTARRRKIIAICVGMGIILSILTVVIIKTL